MCSPAWKTYIPSEMCSPSWETNIPSDMCSPTWETHIPTDIYVVVNFLSQVIFLFLLFQLH